MSAMQLLGACRINPDLKSKVRRDLEFFIPQICSLYLQGHFPSQAELVKFILAASNEFHFSHRVFFFFQSVLLDNILDPEKRQKQEIIIDSIRKKLQEQLRTQDECMFLSNSQELERTLHQYGMAEFFMQISVLKYSTKKMNPPNKIYQ